MFTRVKNEIKKFFHCERSAVTVIVTFFLVPAILITGTGVELARIHANHTVTENAGELAANAALTQYDAVLQDMYGLYAIAMTDDELAELLDAYAKAAFMEGNSTLSLNSGTAAATLNTDDTNYYLSNKEILARQIQEYCKFRGIGALGEDLYDKLKIFDFKKLKVDLDIFDKKLETDDQFKALLEQYGEFYFRLRYNDYFVESATEGAVGKLRDIESIAKQIETIIENYVKSLQEIKNKYENASEEYEGEDLADYKEGLREDFSDTKDRLLNNINYFMNSVPAFTHTSPDSQHRAGANKKPWYVEIIAEISGYNRLIDLFMSPGSDIEYFRDGFLNPDCLTSYSYNLELMLGAAEAINDQIDDFIDAKNALDELIKDGSDITQETMTNQSEVYDRYMNKIDTESVLTSIIANNTAYISAYKEYFENSMFTYEDGVLGYDRIYGILDRLGITSNDSVFAAALSIKLVDYSPESEWGVFCEHTSDGLTENPFYANGPEGLRDLYWVLALQYVNTDAGETKSKIVEALNNIGKSITGLTEKLSNGVQFYPLGHDVIPGELILPSQGGGAASPADSFELQLDNIGENNKQTRNKLKELKATIEAFTVAAIDSVADKALLTVYATHIFSNCATAKKESMAGYKYNAQLNYLQGAEQEYIIIGDRSGFVDLAAFSLIILAIRTVLNFASTFMITGINAYVNSFASAASAVPFVGPALYLLTQFGLRLAIAMGESLLDLYLLRKGKSVPFFKFVSKEFVVGNPDPLAFEKFMEKLGKDLYDSVKDSAVSLTKDLVQVVFSTGEMETESEKAPSETSAKLLDEAAKRKLDNSSDLSDFADLGIDAGVELYEEYGWALDKFTNAKIKEYSDNYLEAEADRRGLDDTQKQYFIDGYKDYLTNENSAEAYYKDIKDELDKKATEISNNIEYARNNPGVSNEYFDEFSSNRENQTILDKLKSTATKVLEDKFEQFTPKKIKDNLGEKFSLKNMLSVDYTFYTGVWTLLTVSRDDLIMRIADLISLNVANKSSKLTPIVDDYENFAAFGYDFMYAKTYDDIYSNGKLPPMTQEIFDKYTLDKRRVFIRVDVAYDMNWTFFSLGLFQSDPMTTGTVFPKTYPIRESVYRGY